MKEENQWLTNRRLRSSSKFWDKIQRKLNKRLECSQMNLKNREEKVPLMSKEQWILKELSTKKYISWTNLTERKQKTIRRLSYWEKKSKNKERKVQLMKPQFKNYNLFWQKRWNCYKIMTKEERKMTKILKSLKMLWMKKEEKVW